MSTIAVIIIVALLGIILWLLFVQRNEWKHDAYYKGLKDGELKATDYEEYHKHMSDGHTPW